jgi:hypothetical protein
MGRLRSAPAVSLGRAPRCQLQSESLVPNLRAGLESDWLDRTPKGPHEFISYTNVLALVSTALR